MRTFKFAIFAHSSDGQGPEVVVRHFVEESQVLVRLQLVHLTNCGAFLRDVADLDLVVTEFVAPEHDSETFLDERLALIGRQVSPPLIVEQDGAEMVSEASRDPVLLNLESVRVRVAEEDFTVPLIDASHDSRNKTRAFSPRIVRSAGDVVVVVSDMHEARTIVLDLVIFELLVKVLLQVLEV